jgi:hypothetical protein
VAAVTGAQVDGDAAEAGGQLSDLADVELEEGAAADHAKHGTECTGGRRRDELQRRIERERELPRRPTSAERQ